MNDYVGPERRNAALTEDKVKLMIQDALMTALKAHEAHITQHMDKQFEGLKESFAQAFPAGARAGRRQGTPARTTPSAPQTACPCAG